MTINKLTYADEDTINTFKADAVLATSRSVGTSSSSSSSNLTSVTTGTAINNSPLATAHYTTASSSLNNYVYWNGFEKDALKTIVSFLTENEIKELLSKIKHKTNDSAYDSYRNLINQFVELRHFSEDFLLENAEDLDISSILCNHRADIQSGEYSSLALLFSVGK